MKIFAPNPEDLPVFSYHREGQALFLNKNRKKLLKTVSSNSKGICFGPLEDCQKEFDILAVALMDDYFLNFSLKELLVDTRPGQRISIVSVALSKSVTKCWKGGELPSIVGEDFETFVVGQVGKPGFLIYGPYIGISPGKYLYTLTYSSNGTQGEAGEYEVVLGDQILGSKKPLMNTNNSDRAVREEFVADSVVSPEKDLSQFRIVSNGNQVVKVKSLCITKSGISEDEQ